MNTPVTRFSATPLPLADTLGTPTTPSVDHSGIDTDRPLTWRDYALLVTFCAALFSISMWSGRPLTMHEAVLPQSARSMLSDGDWLVPKKGAEPWLESPPLPQWCTVAVASLFGRCDSESIVRIAPALVSIGIVLLSVWMGTLLVGSRLALMQGYLFATTFQFTRYAWLAEDEIFLCGTITAALACFVRLEFGAGSALDEPRTWLQQIAGRRSTWMVLFWVALGSTNLVKGILFGTVVAAAPMAVWLFWPGHWSRPGKYVWFWGLVIWLTILLAWPVAVWFRHPDVTAVWWYDLGGRVSGEYREITQPVWYYPVNLLWMLLPWTLLVPVGLWATARTTWREPLSAQRWLWIWAFTVPAVLTIPSGKHHHYLLHGLIPWAMLATLGADRLRGWMLARPVWQRHPVTSLFTVGLPVIVCLAIWGHKLPGPPELATWLMVLIPTVTFVLTWSLWHPQPRVMGLATCSVLLGLYAAGNVVAGLYFDSHRQDVALLKQVAQEATTQGLPVVVDLDRRPLTGFLDLFYQSEQAYSVHNTSFLQAPSFAGHTWIVISRRAEQPALEELGAVEVLAMSERAQQDHRGDARLTAFRLTIPHSALPVAAQPPARVSPMQAMHRAPGPVWR